MALGRDFGSQDPGCLSHDLMKAEDQVMGPLEKEGAKRVQSSW